MPGDPGSALVKYTGNWRLLDSGELELHASTASLIESAAASPERPRKGTLALENELSATSGTLRNAQWHLEHERKLRVEERVSRELAMLEARRMREVLELRLAERSKKEELEAEKLAAQRHALENTMRTYDAETKEVETSLKRERAELQERLRNVERLNAVAELLNLPHSASIGEAWTVALADGMRSVVLERDGLREDVKAIKTEVDRLRDEEKAARSIAAKEAKARATLDAELVRTRDELSRLSADRTNSDAMAQELEAEKEKRVAHLQQLGVKRLRNQSIARAWSAWHGTWFEVTRKRRLMRQAGAYLLRPKLVSAYSSWRRDWEDEQVAQRSMTHEQQLKAEIMKREELQERLSQVMRELEQARQAMHAGRATDEALKRQMEEELEREREKRVAHLQQLGVKRLMNQGLARGWSAWHDMWAERVRKMRLMKRAGGLLLRPRLVHSYRVWRTDWKQAADAQGMEQKRRLAEELAAEKEKRVAHLQQLGVKRLRNQSIARAWSAWHGTWFEVTRKRRLMRQAGAYLLRPKLVSAYSSWRRDWLLAQTSRREHAYSESLAAVSADAHRRALEIEDLHSQIGAARRTIDEERNKQRQLEAELSRARERQRVEVASEASKWQALEAAFEQLTNERDEEEEKLKIALTAAQKAATDANARAEAERAEADAARLAAENVSKLEERLALEVAARQEAEERAHRLAAQSKEHVALQNVALVEARKAATDNLHRFTGEKAELESARATIAELEARCHQAWEAEYTQMQAANRAQARLHEFQEEAEAKMNLLLMEHRAQFTSEITRVTDDYERRLAELRMQLALKSSAPPPTSTPERPPPSRYQVDPSKSVSDNLSALLKHKQMHAIDLFRELDVGKDGYISKEDWRAGLTLLGFHLPEERAMATFVEADADNSGNIEFAEFEQYLKPRPERATSEGRKSPTSFIETTPKVVTPVKKTAKPPQPHVPKFPQGGDKNSRLLAALASSMGVRANVTWFAEAENVSVAAAGGKKAEQFESVMQERAESFGHADLNKDGKLDFDEYCSMVKFRETTQYSEKQLRQKFAEMDVDNSGAVELHEFIAYSLRDAVKRSKGKAIDIFQIWDADKSGYIDLHEFGKAIVALGFVAGKSDIKKCFEMLDEDNSGQIEYKELAKMLRRLGSS